MTLFLNIRNDGPDDRAPDEDLDNVLAAFRTAVLSGEHNYVTLEFMKETSGRLPERTMADSAPQEPRPPVVAGYRSGRQGDGKGQL